MNFRFGPYLLQPQERRLLREGETVAVTPKVFATLLALVQVHGRAVTKEELLAAVWPDRFVEDGSLAQNIFILRKLLAPDFPDVNPIETLPRVGYRFHASVGVEALNASGVADVNVAAFEQHPAVPPVAVIPAERPTSPWQLRWWRWALPIVLALFALAAFWAYAPLAGFRSRGVSLDLTRFTTKPSENQVAAAALSPDGRVIAYADADGIVLQAIGEPTTHAVRAPASKTVSRLAWFADGLHLAASVVAPDSHTMQVWILSTVGDAPLLLREDAQSAVPAPEGSVVAFTTGNGSEIWLSGMAGEGARRMLLGQPSEQFPTLLWSRDGRHLLLQRRISPPGQATSATPEIEAGSRDQLAFLSLDTESAKISATAEGISMTNACLLREDQLLFSHPEATPGTSLWKVRIDPATGGFVSKPEKLKDIPGFGVRTLSFAEQSGQGIAVLDRALSQVYVGVLQQPGPTLRDVSRLSLDEGTAYPHAWTADSKAVFFESNYVGHDQIYKQRLDQHDPAAVIVTTEYQSAPRVSPDGRWILFASRSQGSAVASLFRVPMQGGRPLAVNTGTPARDFRCPASGSSCVLRTVNGDRSMVFSALDPVSGKGGALFVQSADSKEPADWDISPDGSMLALIVQHSAAPALRVARLSTGRTEDIPIRVGARITAVNWAADQKGWFVADATPAGGDLFYVNLAGEAKLLRSTATGTWGVPSPDGHKLAFVDRTVDSNVWFLHFKRAE